MFFSSHISPLLLRVITIKSALDTRLVRSSCGWFEWDPRAPELAHTKKKTSARNSPSGKLSGYSWCWRVLRRMSNVDIIALLPNSVMNVRGQALLHHIVSHCYVMKNGFSNTNTLLDGSRPSLSSVSVRFDKVNLATPNSLICFFFS